MPLLVLLVLGLCLPSAARAKDPEIIIEARKQKNKIVVPPPDEPVTAAPMPDLTLHETGRLTENLSGLLIVPKIAPSLAPQTETPDALDGSGEQTGSEKQSGPAPAARTPRQIAASNAAGVSAEQNAVHAPPETAYKLSVQAGNSFLQSNHPEDADRNFQRALKANPGDPAALTGHVQALLEQGNKAEAGREANRLLALQPENQFAQKTLRTLDGIDRASGAAKRFQKLGEGLMHGPEDPGGAPRAPAAPGAAKPGFAKADIAVGVRPVDSPQGGSGADFPPLLKKAVEKRDVGDYTGALLDVLQVLDQDPKSAGAWTLRAELDNQLENYPAAIGDATQALALGPAGARALRARAYAELQSGQDKAALADAARAIELDPNKGLGYLYRAMAEDKLGLSADAERDLAAALRLDPTLEPLAGALRRKYAPIPVPLRAPRWALRGGLLVLSLSLVLFGLLGTERGRALTARLTPRRFPAPEPGAPEPAALEPGSRLDAYRIVREVGRGGMGIVYEGFDETLQRRVAIKRLLRDERTMPEDVERFLKEARLVAQLKHPNLAQIHAALALGELFLVFEFVDGVTLDRALAEARVMTPARTRRIVAEAASALTSAHERGIIHRDLKPANVMIAPDGSAKIMDFGIAHQSRAGAAQMTMTSASGTPPYMAPEQGFGSVSKASDLYALGVMAYELLTGRRPFDGPDFLEQKLQRRFPPATSLNPVLPDAFDAFFDHALNPDPTKRPADAAAFAAAFNGACDATPRQRASV